MVWTRVWTSQGVDKQGFVGRPEDPIDELLDNDDDGGGGGRAARPNRRPPLGRSRPRSGSGCGCSIVQDGASCTISGRWGCRNVGLFSAALLDGAAMMFPAAAAVWRDPSLAQHCHGGERDDVSAGGELREGQRQGREGLQFTRSARHIIHY